MKYHYHFRDGIKKYKTKTYFAVASLVVILAGSAAAIPMVSAAGAHGMQKWHLVAPTTIDFNCGGSHFIHTLATLKSGKKGKFTGTGYYNPNTTFTWDAKGKVKATNLALTITYTGTSAGAVYNLKGTIAPDGSVSGTADSNCQTFTMPAGSASSKHQVRHDDQDEKDDKDSDDIKVLPI